jgi:hypothetical protein
VRGKHIALKNFGRSNKKNSKNSLLNLSKFEWCNPAKIGLCSQHV